MPQARCGRFYTIEHQGGAMWSNRCMPMMNNSHGHGT